MSKVKKKGFVIRQSLDSPMTLRHWGDTLKLTWTRDPDLYVVFSHAKDAKKTVDWVRDHMRKNKKRKFSDDAINAVCVVPIVGDTFLAEEEITKAHEQAFSNVEKAARAARGRVGTGGAFAHASEVKIDGVVYVRQSLLAKVMKDEEKVPGFVCETAFAPGKEPSPSSIVNIAFLECSLVLGVEGATGRVVVLKDRQGTKPVGMRLFRNEAITMLLDEAATAAELGPGRVSGDRGAPEDDGEPERAGIFDEIPNGRKKLMDIRKAMNDVRTGKGSSGDAIHRMSYAVDKLLDALMLVPSPALSSRG